jgi:hypothetical protein
MCDSYAYPQMPEMASTSRFRFSVGGAIGKNLNSDANGPCQGKIERLNQ